MGSDTKKDRISPTKSARPVANYLRVVRSGKETKQDYEGSKYIASGHSVGPDPYLLLLMFHSPFQGIYKVAARHIPPTHPPGPGLFRWRSGLRGASRIATGQRANCSPAQEMDNRPRQVRLNRKWMTSGIRSRCTARINHSGEFRLLT